MTEKKEKSRTSYTRKRCVGNLGIRSLSSSSRKKEKQTE